MDRTEKMTEVEIRMRHLTPNSWKTILVKDITKADLMFLKSHFKTKEVVREHPLESIAVAAVVGAVAGVAVSEGIRALMRRRN